MNMAPFVSLEADSNFGWQQTPFASQGQRPVGITRDWPYIAAVRVVRITGVVKGAQCPLWARTGDAISAHFRVRSLFPI